MTAARIKRWPWPKPRRGDSTVRVLSHSQNRGYGAAIRTGFAASTKQLIGFTDADCQFDLRQLDRLVLLLADCDIACGYRIARQDALLRKVYSKGYNLLVRMLLGTGVRDCDCALKLMRRDALQALTLETDGFLFNAELLAQVRLQEQRVVEVGVDHRPRTLGTSTVSIGHVLPVLIALLRFWWTGIQFPNQPATTQASLHRDRGVVTPLATLLLCGLCLLVFFWHLAYPLFEPDESRYVQIALEMVQSQDYLVPRLQGEPYLDKPPLLYWATAGSFLLFGVSESSARLVPACSATWTVLAVFLLGGRLLGARRAWLAALLLLLSIGFVLAGRYVLMDGLLTCCTTTSFLASFLAIRGHSLRWTWWIVAAFSTGLGLLTKGPVAVALVVPPLAALGWLNPSLARIRAAHWLAFGAVAFGLTLPWFLAMARVEPAFAQYFLWKHHVMRFVDAFDHQQPFWYYLPVLLVGLFPCSLLTAPALALLVSRRESVRRSRTPELGLVVLAALWVLLFFSFSSCKLPTYVLPAAPLLCLVAATTLDTFLQRRTPLPLHQLVDQLPVWAIMLALLIGSGLAIADLVLQPEQGGAQLLNWLVLLASVIVLLYQFVVRSWPASRSPAWSTAGVICLLVTLFAFQKFVPGLAHQRSIHANTAAVRQSMGPPTLPIAYLDWQIDAQSLYFAEPCIARFQTTDLDPLTDYFATHKKVLFVANRHDAELVRQKMGVAATFQQLPVARGRLYLVSTVADRTAIAHSARHPQRRQQRR